MIELALGKNHFMLLQHVAKLKDEYLQNHGEDSVQVLDAADTDWDRLVQAVSGMSLFSGEDQLVILRGIEQNIALGNRVADSIEQLSGSTHLLIVSYAPDKRSSLYKAIKKEAIVTEFAVLKEQELQAWIREYVEEQGGSISAADARFLQERVGDNQQLIASEITKLISHDTSITKEAITQLVPETLQESIFELLDTITSGNQSKATNIYQSLRQQQVQPIYILTMIAWQLHSVLVVSLAGDRSEAQIAKDNGISPFVVGKASRLRRRISHAAVQEMIAATAEADIQIKTTPANDDQVLQTLILKLVQSIA